MKRVWLILNFGIIDEAFVRLKYDILSKAIKLGLGLNLKYFCNK